MVMYLSSFLFDSFHPIIVLLLCTSQGPWHPRNVDRPLGGICQCVEGCSSVGLQLTYAPMGGGFGVGHFFTDDHPYHDLLYPANHLISLFLERVPVLYPHVCTVATCTVV